MQVFICHRSLSTRKHFPFFSNSTRLTTWSLPSVHHSTTKMNYLWLVDCGVQSRLKDGGGTALNALGCKDKFIRYNTYVVITCIIILIAFSIECHTVNGDVYAVMKGLIHQDGHCVVVGIDRGLFLFELIRSYNCLIRCLV